MNFINKYVQTFQTLLSEPRQVIDSFLNEDRHSYTHPFLYCLMGALFVVALNTLFVDFTVTPEVTDMDSDNNDLQEIAAWMQIASVRASTQFLPFSIFFVLIVSLAVGGVLFMRDKTGGFYDQIVINTYAVGTSILPLLILIPVWGYAGQSLLDPFMNSTVPAMVIAGVILWVYRLYFDVNSFMDWIRILSAYITGYFIFAILLGFVSAVIAYVLFVVDRLSDLAA